MNTENTWWNISHFCNSALLEITNYKNFSHTKSLIGLETLFIYFKKRKWTLVLLWLFLEGSGIDWRKTGLEESERANGATLHTSPLSLTTHTHTHTHTHNYSHSYTGRSQTVMVHHDKFLCICGIAGLVCVCVCVFVCVGERERERGRERRAFACDKI